MALAIIGGTPERFAPVAELHRRAAAEAGHPRPALGVNSHGFVAQTSRRAADLAFPPFATMMNRIGRERGWAPMSRADFDASASLRGANFVGSPQQVIEKILYQHQIFGHDRFLMQLTVGTLPHDEVMRAIELFGTEVARSCVARSPPGGSRPRRSGRVGSGTLGGRGTDDRGDPP
jgi:alkanesulfonate monooxygenase SsuD/methylene tetrahydromethanopterin reductase-like flavin-dependent oxidoreductase (luciferase family)